MTDHIDSVTLNYKVTQADVFRAIVSSTVHKLWITLLLPVFGAIATVWAALNPSNGAVTIGQGIIMLAIGLLIFVVLPFMQTRAVMKTPNFGRPMSLTVSESGIDFVGEHSNARTDWSLIKGVSEASHSVLVSIKPAGFLIVPTRQLESADIAAFKSLRRQHVSGKVKLTKE